ncbi:MAG: hypothetical protein KDA62_18240, partial [Planctomycetales bacterium]|nr:hypothetical protein [Planctomycetales bacterium]
MRASTIELWLLTASFLLATGSVRAVDRDPAAAAFRDRVAPILERRCWSCHNDQDRKGGLSLETGQALAKGGDSGEVVVAGEPESSYLLDL